MHVDFPNPTPGADAGAPTAAPAVVRARAELTAALRANGDGGRLVLSRPLAAAVFAYTRALRSAGVPPERALVAVKRVVGDTVSERVVWMDARHGPNAPLRQIVLWFVEEYYREANARPLADVALPPGAGRRGAGE